MPTPFPLTPPYAARTLLPTLGRAQRKRTCPEITCPKSLAYPVAPAPPPVGRPLLPTLSSAAALLKLVICSARRHFLRCAHQSLRVLRHSCRQRRKGLLPSNPFVPFRAHTGSHARTHPPCAGPSSPRHPVTVVVVVEPGTANLTKSPSCPCLPCTFPPARRFRPLGLWQPSLGGTPQ